MIDIRPGNYISRIWFLYQPGGCGGFDVLAHLWRRLPEGPWIFEYRFRYYVDEKTHDSKDRKSGYTATVRDAVSEAEIRQKVERALQVILAALPGGFQMDRTDIETDEPRAVLHLLGKKPYLHLKIEDLPT